MRVYLQIRTFVLRRMSQKVRKKLVTFYYEMCARLEVGSQFGGSKFSLPEVNKTMTQELFTHNLTARLRLEPRYDRDWSWLKFLAWGEYPTDIQQAICDYLKDPNGSFAGTFKRTRMSWASFTRVDFGVVLEELNAIISPHLDVVDVVDVVEDKPTPKRAHISRSDAELVVYYQSEIARMQVQLDVVQKRIDSKPKRPTKRSTKAQWIAWAEYLDTQA